MKEPVYRAVGAKIEQLRNLLGITQTDLAKRMRLTRCSITNAEAGRQRIQLHQLEQYAKALGSTPKALLRGIWL